MNAQVRPGRFNLAWIVACIAVLPLSAALSIVVILAASALLEVFDDEWYMTIAGSLIMLTAVSCMINGICIGFLQKAIVKRYLGFDLGPWVVYSAIGALLAGIIAQACLGGACMPPFYDFGFSIDGFVSVEAALVVIIYLTVFSAAQAIGLRRRVRGAWRWVAAHLGSQLLAAFLAVALIVAAPGMAQFNALLTLVLSVAFASMATAWVMQRMLITHQIATGEAHDEWAFEPAPAETQVSAESSVWDEAV